MGGNIQMFWSMMSVTNPNLTLLIWKLQGDTVRNLYLTQKSTDGLFSKFVYVWQHHRPKITLQIPEKVSFS